MTPEGVDVGKYFIRGVEVLGMISQEAFVHAHALVDNGVSIGARTRVWAFAHIAYGASIGDDCNICDHTFIEGNVHVGNRVTIKSGVYLWDGVEVGDGVFIGPCATFTNDLRPRSGNRSYVLTKTKLCEGCTIGANSTILPVTVGRWAMVAAGAVVTREVPSFALVVGNPARIRAWVCRCGQLLKFCSDSSSACCCGQAYSLRDGQVTEEN